MTFQNTVTGETTMTPDGEAVRAPVVLIVKDGKFVAAR